MKKILFSLSLLWTLSSCSAPEEVRTTHRINFDGSLDVDFIQWIFVDNKVYLRLSNGDMVEMPFEARRVSPGTIVMNGAIFLSSGLETE